jgi:PAS domain S-box-containing protein
MTRRDAQYQHWCTETHSLLYDFIDRVTGAAGRDDGVRVAAWQFLFALALAPVGTLIVLELLGLFANARLPLLLLQAAVLCSLGWYLAREAQRRQQVQADLALSEQQYRLLSEHAQEVVWAVDRNGNLIYVSPSVQDLRGYTRAEMLRGTWEDRIAAGLSPRMVQEIHKALEGLAAGRPVNPAPFVVEQMHKYGLSVWTEVSIAPIYDEAGQPVGLRGASRDVTQRVRAIEALRRSEERFAKMFRAAPGGIALSRRADGCYHDANDAFLQLTGYGRAELIGHTSIELGIVTPQAREALLGALDAQGMAQEMEFQIVTKRGERRDVRYVIEAIEMDDGPHLISAIIDLSAEKALERALRANNEELEARVARRTAALEVALADQQRALRARDEFMAMVSHELRTPLTGAITMAELLQEQIAGPLTARQITYVDAIHSSGMRLLATVNSIIGYTRLVAGDVAFEPQVCSLASVLDLAAHAPRRLAQAQQQSLTIAVDPPGLLIVSDEQALGEVVRRLLDNAVKFTPPGGSIGVEATPTRGAGGGVDGRTDASKEQGVQITVWDTGPGLDPATLLTLSRPFTQGDGSLSRPYEGIGMGLAHVQQLVPLLGGRIELAPNPSGGSRFTITLPPVLPVPTVRRGPSHLPRQSCRPRGRRT